MLPKPVTADDVDRLHDLARRLAGRPVPGVRMTEREFEAWCDEDVKAEWVGGEVVIMAPDNAEHMILTIWLLSAFNALIEDGAGGRVLGPNFLVRLPRQRRRRCPDVLYVTEPRLPLIRHTFLDGPPDLAVEIVSPDSESRDWRIKYREYERAGVREYWVFDPMSQRVEAYARGKDKRFHLIDEAGGWVASAVLPGFRFKPAWLERPALPQVARALRDMRGR